RFTGAAKLAPTLLALLTLPLGCTGNIGNGDGRIDGGKGTAGLPASLRRLTLRQFQNSMKDLLGDVTLSEVEADTSLDGFASLGAAQVTLSPHGVELYET